MFCFSFSSFQLFFIHIHVQGHWVAGAYLSNDKFTDRPNLPVKAVVTKDFPTNYHKCMTQDLIWTNGIKTTVRVKDTLQPKLGKIFTKGLANIPPMQFHFKVSLLTLRKDQVSYMFFHVSSIWQLKLQQKVVWKKKNPMWDFATWFCPSCKSQIHSILIFKCKHVIFCWKKK